MITDQHLDPEAAAARLSERLAKAGVNKSISPRRLEAWRAQGKGPAFAKVLGRIQYPKPSLDSFAASLLKAQEPGRPAGLLLPGSALAQQPTLADTARVWWLTEAGSAAGRPPHAGQIDAAIARAAHSLIALSEKAARDAVVAMALHRAEQARHGMQSVQPIDLAKALRELAAEFECQVTQLALDACATAIARDQLQSLRAPLREAVSTRLDRLIAEQQALASKRSALGHGKLAALDSELVAAGIPADRLAAVREAAGAPNNVPAAVEELSGQITGLMSSIEKLKAYSAQHCAPGDYSLLDGEGLDGLIAAERLALGFDKVNC